MGLALAIRRDKSIIASEEDAEVFFDVLSNPKEPTEFIKQKVKEFQEWVRNMKT